MQKRKIGLALGSGAARGLAHIGVLEVLEKEGIPVNLIAGTSAGAAVGALYAQGKNTTQIKKLVLDLGWKKFAPLVDLSLPKTGFIRGKKIKDLLTLFIGGDIKFSDLKIPFACVATDIETGEEIRIEAEGLLARCLAHEIDHINGILFIDHLSPLKRNLIRNKIKKLVKSGDW